MRLSDFSKLVLELFHGGVDAAARKMQQINQSRPSHQRITPQLLWHFWAILAMLAVNYFVVVHLPQWSQAWSQFNESQVAAANIQWSPEVWQTENLPQLSTNSATKSYPVQKIVDVEPVPINLHQVRRRINIPYQLRGLNTTARVKLRVLVDEKGDYVRHRQPQHLYPELAQAVNQQAAKLSFLPALRNGKPVPYWVEVRFVFEL
ncbi:MAG: energy transducer TonB [Bacteroidota bacterium]